MTMIKGSLLALFLAFVLFAQGQQPATGVISASYPDGNPFTQPVAFTAYDIQRGLLFGAGSDGKIYTFNSTTLVLLSTNDLRTMFVGTINFSTVTIPLGIYLRPGNSPRLVTAYTLDDRVWTTTNAGHTILLDCSNVYNMSALAALNVTSSYTPTIYDSNFFHADSFTYFALYTDSNIRSTYIFGYRLTNDSFWMTRSKLTVILPNANHAGIYSYSGGKTSVYNTKPWYNGSKFVTFDHELSTSTTFVATKLAFGTEVVTQGTDGKTITFRNTREFANPPGFESLRYFEEGSRDVPTIKMFTVGSNTNSGYILYDLNSIPYAGNLVVQVSASDLAIESRDTLIPKSFNIFPNQQAFNTIEVDENVDTTNTTRVMFFGTKSGRVMKYRYYDNGGQLSIDYNPITSENVVSPGIYFTQKQVIHSEKRIFISSSHEAPSDSPKLFIVPFADCGSRTSCDSCVAMNDPYCGWCVLDGKCSYKSSCSSATTSGGWQQTTGKCPSVSNVETISIYAEPVWISLNPSPLTFTINNIIPGDYSCEYKRENGSKYYKEVQGSLPNLWCGRPRIVTPLTNGSPSETLSVSLSYLNPSSGLYSNVVQISNTIPLYDCNSFSTCESCVLLPGCGWMSDFNQCADETAFDVNANLPTQCPRTDSNFIGLYPHNQTISLSLSGSNYPYGMDYPLTCAFSTGESVPITRLDSNLVSCESPLVIIESDDILPYKEVFIQVKHGDVVFPGQAKIVFIDIFKFDLLDF